jgi:hypothetical protein
MGGQTSRLALTLGVLLKLMLLPIERLQPVIGIAPTSLVFGQRYHSGEISVRQPLKLLTEGGAATAQIGLTCLQFLWQPVSATCPLHGVCDHLRSVEHLAQVAPDQFLQRTCRDVARWAALAG